MNIDEWDKLLKVLNRIATALEVIAFKEKIETPKKRGVRTKITT